MACALRKVLLSWQALLRPELRFERDIRSTLLGYLRLTKPRIVGLLVVTTLPAMIMAEGGYRRCGSWWPQCSVARWWRVVPTR